MDAPPSTSYTESSYVRRTAAILSGMQTGTLLINLGTPTEPTPAAVRTYLREFLSDPYVVEIPRPIWWVILNLFILPRRGKDAAARYASVWTKEGSPLIVTSQTVQRKLASALRGPPAGEGVGEHRGCAPIIPASGGIRTDEISALITH